MKIKLGEINIKIRRNRYGQFRKSHYNFYKWTAILSLTMIAGLFIGNEIYHKKLEIDYANCLKKWENNLSVSCDTDEYFVYRSVEAETTPKTSVKAKDDTNCVYNIKDSKNGNFKVNCNHIKEIVKEFGPDTTLIAIIFQESGFNPLAKNINKNGTEDFGIFQLNSKYWTIKQGDINHSIAQAKLCKKQNGYNCWVAYSTKAYVEYLDEAELLLSKI